MSFPTETLGEPQELRFVVYGTREVSMLLLWGFVLACGKNSADPDSKDGGGYEDGVYHCCDEGEGTSCCDGYEQGMCFQYGGIYGACLAAGKGFDAKIECAFCCDGLDRAAPMVKTDEVWEGYPKGCGPSAPPSWFVCIACGDGTCGAGENQCMCPEDCP